MTKLDILENAQSKATKECTFTEDELKEFEVIKIEIQFEGVELSKDRIFIPVRYICKSRSDGGADENILQDR